MSPATLSRSVAVLLWALVASACAVGVRGRLGEHPRAGTVEEGWASWYGTRYQGRRTASGEPFDMSALTAAHRRWAFGTRVRVTHLRSGREVVVRINDRGPYAKRRILDLSREGARVLGMLRQGQARVRIEVID